MALGDGDGGWVVELRAGEGMLRKGEDVRRSRGVDDDGGSPKPGDRLRSDDARRGLGSSTEVRTGDVNGKPSSAGFFGVRTRAGD